MGVRKPTRVEEELRKRKRRDVLMRMWIADLDARYRGMYRDWCIERHMLPNWDQGYYQFLCTLSIDSD